MPRKLKRHCTAKSRQTGKPCGYPPIHGGFVCRFHGGSLPRVKAKAAERLADLIDPDRTLRETARLAFSDLRELFDEEGQLKPVKRWPDHLAAAVSSVEVLKHNEVAGDGKQEAVVKIRLWDKNAALEKLFRHLALFRDKLDVNVGFSDEAERRLKAARERIANARSR